MSALRALIAGWRVTADARDVAVSGSVISPCVSTTSGPMRRCADELEAKLDGLRCETCQHFFASENGNTSHCANENLFEPTPDDFCSRHTPRETGGGK